MPRRRKLLRLIVPAYPKFNIYTQIASKTTGLGLVLVGSAANKLMGWEVEILDENNCKKRKWPKNAPDGYIDHAELQKHRRADIVGFYGSMSSCIPRVYELAKLYQETGATTIVGGFHARALPQDMLNHNIDLVVMEDGEQPILDILQAYDLYSEQNFEQSAGVGVKHINIFWCMVSDVSFMSDGKMITTPPRVRTEQCPPWPLPDFGLIRFARIKTYPLRWKPGCPKNCEFCAVTEKPKFVAAEEFLARVEYLVETQRAKHFFIVDDHFGGLLEHPDDYAEAMKLLRQLQQYQQRIGKRLSFTIQIRLEMAEKTELLAEMRKAGIDMVCIGFESPIDSELFAMDKGYDSSEMIRWARLWRQAGFFVHGMFMFAYPENPKKKYTDDDGNPPPQLTVNERADIYRNFIKQSKIHTAQVLLTVPIPGTPLWNRLEEAGRILHDIGWEYYDGQWPTYLPYNATPEELQDAMKSIMGEFYHFGNILKLIANWCLWFPIIVFPSVATLVTFRTKYIVSAYRTWRKKFHRNTWIRAGGWFIVKHWTKQLKSGGFRDKLKKAQEALIQSSKKGAS